MTFHFINTPKEIFQPLTALENTLIPPNLTHPPADLSHCSNGMFLFRRNLGSRGISLKPSFTGAGVPHLHHFTNVDRTTVVANRDLFKEVLVHKLKFEMPLVDYF